MISTARSQLAVLSALLMTGSCLAAQLCPSDTSLVSRVRSAEWAALLTVAGVEICNRHNSRLSGSRIVLDTCRAARYSTTAADLWKGDLAMDDPGGIISSKLPEDGGPAPLANGRYLLLGFWARTQEWAPDSTGRMGSVRTVILGPPYPPFLHLGECAGFIEGPLDYARERSLIAMKDSLLGN